MPDTSGSGVHLKYLVALKDFSKIGEYSWGSACLAMLYNHLCQASNKKATNIGGCLIQLQTWAWSIMPFIAPVVRHPENFPFARM
jgi:hypothetical protein